jgi:hypothetical protein
MWKLSLFNYRFSVNLSLFKDCLYIINRKAHACLEIPDLFLVLNMISHWFVALTREISCSTLEINLVFPSTHVLFSIYTGYVLNFCKYLPTSVKNIDVRPVKTQKIKTKAESLEEIRPRIFLISSTKSTLASRSPDLSGRLVHNRCFTVCTTGALQWIWNFSALY